MFSRMKMFIQNHNVIHGFIVEIGTLHCEIHLTLSRAKRIRHNNVLVQ